MKSREASKNNWNPNEPPTYKNINLGSLQRITDSGCLPKE